MIEFIVLAYLCVLAVTMGWLVHATKWNPWGHDSYMRGVAAAAGAFLFALIWPITVVRVIRGWEYWA